MSDCLCEHPGSRHDIGNRCVVPDCRCECFRSARPVLTWTYASDRLTLLEKALAEVKDRCDCRWADTSEKLDELADVPAALPEGAVVLSRMPTDDELRETYWSLGERESGFGLAAVVDLLRSLVVPS